MLPVLNSKLRAIDNVRCGEIKANQRSLCSPDECHASIHHRTVLTLKEFVLYNLTHVIQSFGNSHGIVVQHEVASAYVGKVLIL